MILVQVVERAGVVAGREHAHCDGAGGAEGPLWATGRARPGALGCAPPLGSPVSQFISTPQILTSCWTKQQPSCGLVMSFSFS